MFKLQIKTNITSIPINPLELFPFTNWDLLDSKLFLSKEKTLPPSDPIIKVLPKGLTVTKVFRIVDDYIEFSPLDYANASHDLVKFTLESYFGPGKGWKRSKDLPPNTIRGFHEHSYAYS